MRSELVEAKGGWRTRGRADDALELLDHGLVVESIGLLVVAEHNLSLWEQLRIANLRQREPEHLESVVEDAWATPCAPTRRLTRRSSPTSVPSSTRLRRLLATTVSPRSKASASPAPATTSTTSRPGSPSNAPSTRSSLSA